MHDLAMQLLDVMIIGFAILAALCIVLGFISFVVMIANRDKAGGVVRTPAEEAEQAALMDRILHPERHKNPT